MVSGSPAALSRQDLKVAFDYIYGAYAAPDVDVLGAHIARQMPAVIPGPFSTYNEFDMRGPRVVRWIKTFDHLPGADLVFANYMSEHPMLTYFGRFPESRAMKLSDFVSQAAWRRTGIYNEFYRPMNIEHILAVTIGVGRAEVSVSLLRDGRDYSGRDRAILTLLRPHLAQAYRSAAGLSEYRSELALLRRGIDSSGFGAIVLHADGHPRTITGRARTLLAAYMGPGVQDDELPQRLRAWLKKSSLPATADAEPHQDPPGPLEIHGARGRLVAVLLHEGAMRVILLHELRSALTADDLRSLGLSRRESEVLAWLTMGKADAEIAAILSISPRTVNHTVEKIYLKLGVASRVGAARRALLAAQQDFARS